MKSGYWNTCTIVCWALAVLAGVVVFSIALEPTSFIAALLVGAALAVFLGLVLTRLFCVNATDAGHGAAVADEGAKADTTADTGATEKAPAEKAKQAKVSSTPDYDGDGIKEGSTEGTKPATLTGPRDGGADDLKQIKGIGPKLEELCNSLGFYHFDQIANWSRDEVAWMDANLQGFKGRVSRDTWVAQARVLASGGETEFSKRVEDGDVY
ncbi:MAG: NADH:ubiquinone oxidoreductase [Roseovarius sp.]|nr:NADH:ubiquinone oxidoreductase [Roseovarius sp.]